MKEIKVTNLVKFFVILLLNEGPKHGYEIIKDVGLRLGRRPSPGQIYPFLKQLEHIGYIQSRGREEREKKIFYLTSKGKKFVDNLSERFDSLIGIIIKPRLTICSHCRCEIYRGGYGAIIKGKKLTFCCIDCAKSYKK